MSAAASLIPYLSLIQRSLPKESLPWFIAGTGKVLATLQKSRRKVVEKNLSCLDINAPPCTITKTIENWTICVSDQARSLWLSKNQLQSMVLDCWSKNLQLALSKKRGVVLVTSHLGNYELAGSYLASFGLPVHAVVEEIPGGHSRTFNRIRERFGMKVIGYSDVPRMLQVLKKGKILVLLADRDIGGGGIVVRFAKGLRSVPIGPALLAQRTGAVLQTGYLVLDGGKARYRCVINPPMEPALNGSLKKRISCLTQILSTELNDAIRNHPDQWFVFQDEWKTYS